MSVPNQHFILQTEEDIEDAVWMDKTEWPIYKEKCYESIQQIIEDYWHKKN